MPSERVIKKYPNRRLYDTEVSHYVTLDDVRALVMHGVNFRVLDTSNNEDITRAILLKNLSSFSNKEYNGLFFDDFRQSLSLIIEKGQQQGHMRNDVPALKLATLLEGIFTLFIIDCLIKKSYSMTSQELFHRLHLSLEGMMKAEATDR